MKIRDAEMKDTKRLDELLTKLIHDEAQYDSNLNRECVVTDNYCSQIGLSGNKVLIAEDNGEIVGYLYGFLYCIPEINKKTVAILDALYVEEKYRRKGYATALFSEFLSFAKKSGAYRIELKVVSYNYPAVAFYEKLTFRETKRYMNLEF